MIDENQIPVLLNSKEIEKLQLTPEDFFILSRINGLLTVIQISQMVGFSIEKTKEGLQKFLDHKVVEFKQVEEKKKKFVSEAQTITDTLDLEDKDPILSQIPRSFRNRVLLLFHDLPGRNYFQMLEVTPSDDFTEIRKNYLRMVKEFHPDSLHGKEPGHYKQKLEAIFDKIQESYQAIEKENERAAYLHSLMGAGKSGKEEKKQGYQYEVPKKDIKVQFASAKSQFEMGQKEETRGNLKAAMNFYQMAMTLDSANKDYEKAFYTVKKKWMLKIG